MALYPKVRGQVQTLQHLAVLPFPAGQRGMGGKLKTREHGVSEILLELKLKDILI